MSTTIDETTRVAPLTEADVPDRCPRWCTGYEHVLSEFDDEVLTTEDQRDAALHCLREHRSDIPGGGAPDLLTHMLARLVAEPIRRSDEPVTLRRGGAFWSVVLLADHDELGDGSWGAQGFAVLTVQSPGPDNQWDAGHLKMTSAEARLMARHLLAAADALDFNRPIGS